MNKMKKIMIFVVLLMSSIYLFSQEVVEAIVAIVNDEIISLSEFKREHDEFVQILRSQLEGEEFTKQYNAMKDMILENMITDKLLLQEAKKENLDPAEQIRMTIDKIKEENNLSSDEQLRQAMRQQGIDFDVWRKRLEERFLKENVIYKEVGSSIVIDDSQIIEYYNAHPEEFREPEEVTLKAVYVDPQGKTDEEVEAKKQTIIDRLNSGEDFAVVASELSEGPGKEEGGDMGSFKQGELEESLWEAVAKVQEGETTSWLNLRGIWILLKLEDRQESRIKSFDEVRDEIQEKMYNEQRQTKLDEYLKELKERSYIKILIPNPIDYGK